jgi:hypothetical protein
MHEYFGAPTTFEVLSEGQRLLLLRASWWALAGANEPARDLDIVCLVTSNFHVQPDQRRDEIPLSSAHW